MVWSKYYSEKNGATHDLTFNSIKINEEASTFTKFEINQGFNEIEHGKNILVYFGLVLLRIHVLRTFHRLRHLSS